MAQSEAAPGIATALLEAELESSVPMHGRVFGTLRHRSLLAGLVIFVAILILVLGAPLFARSDPLAQDPNAIFQAPSVHHLMGTDEFGRDMLSRVLFGGRYTIFGSVLVVIIGASIGSILGLTAGFIGGLVDMTIMRFVDLLLAFPGILLALAVTTILGPGLTNAIIAIGVASVPVYARVVQGATLEVRGLLYTEAAMAIGANSAHIIRKHILPNVRSHIIVLATTWLGIATLYVAALGFLGLGLQPPTPEWGAILNDGKDYVTLAWWVSFFPGVFISLYVVATNLIGDGLRDVIDPTLGK